MPCIYPVGYDEPIGPGHEICRVPVLVEPKTHATKSRYVIGPKYIDWDRIQPYYYLDDCVCNELGSLKGRHLKKVVNWYSPYHIQKRITGRQANYLSKLLGRHETITRQEFVSKYGGPKRKAYERALQNLEQQPNPKSYISAHVKKEKHTLQKYRPARLIQARTKEYNIEFGTFYRRIEHAIYNLKGDGVHFPKGRLCAKSRSIDQRAADILKHFSQFDNPTIYNIDHSAFDSSVNIDLLNAEHKVYLNCTLGDKDALNKLLYKQRKNIGFTKNGIKYKTVATRMSGDVNTAAGNCVINLMVLNDVFGAIFPVDKYWIYVDGDDSVVITEGTGKQEVSPASFMPYGLSTKVECHIDGQLSDIDFCQSKIVRTINGPVLVNNPIKIISTFGDYYREVMPHEQLMAARGVLESVINAGVPIVYEYALRALRQFNPNSKVYRRLEYTDRYYTYKMVCGNRKSNIITPQARIDFSNAFGIDILEQLKIESDIRSSNDVTLSRMTRISYAEVSVSEQDKCFHYLSRRRQ